jgi:selenocysteine-specific elongation factor
MHVIGTAGHVDHGKSTLVKTLTGINPDRLKEEQEREMTIDLGFAWLRLPNGESVSVVDVPGHEDFIRNMLAGISGIDAALFVVAADEGVMPQTREHLAILDLLKISGGVVALTKSDLVEDSEWLELVEQDITGLLAPTSLSGAKIIPVSARTGKGIPELIDELASLLDKTPVRQDVGRPRLSIDRIFSMTGFGTIAAGTLIDGRMRVADEVQIMPAGLKARIRGIQSHKTQVETASPGSRIALNLNGVGTDQLKRGDVITLPGCFASTAMADVRLAILADAPTALRYNMEVEFFSGSARITARTRILGVQEIAPGKSGWVQLCFSEPAILAKSDRFILRQFSPNRTLGGGIVVEPHPQSRHPRFRPEVIEQLDTLADGSPDEILLQRLRQKEPFEAAALVQSCSLPESVAGQALERMLSAGRILALGSTDAGTNFRTLAGSKRYLISAAGWQSLLERIVKLVGEYHRQYPLRAGMPREELKSRLHLDARPFDEIVALAAGSGRITETRSILFLPTHAVKLTASQQTQLDRLVNLFRENRFSPPSMKEATAEAGAELMSVFLNREDLVKVSEEFYFLKDAYEEIIRRIVEHIKSRGALTVAEMRDMFGMSRKYILPFLDHLDARKITKRMGDNRVLP